MTSDRMNMLVARLNKLNELKRLKGLHPITHLTHLIDLTLLTLPGLAKCPPLSYSSRHATSDNAPRGGIPDRAGGFRCRLDHHGDEKSHAPQSNCGGELGRCERCEGVLRRLHLSPPE